MSDLYDPTPVSERELGNAIDFAVIGDWVDMFGLGDAPRAKAKLIADFVKSKGPEFILSVGDHIGGDPTGGPSPHKVDITRKMDLHYGDFLEWFSEESNAVKWGRLPVRPNGTPRSDPPESTTDWHDPIYQEMRDEVGLTLADRARACGRFQRFFQTLGNHDYNEWFEADRITADAPAGLEKGGLTGVMDDYFGDIRKLPLPPGCEFYPGDPWDRRAEQGGTPEVGTQNGGKSYSNGGPYGRIHHYALNWKGIELVSVGNSPDAWNYDFWNGTTYFDFNNLPALGWYLNIAGVRTKPDHWRFHFGHMPPYSSGTKGQGASEATSGRLFRDEVLTGMSGNRPNIYFGGDDHHTEHASDLDTATQSGNGDMQTFVLGSCGGVDTPTADPSDVRGLNGPPTTGNLSFQTWFRQKEMAANTTDPMVAICKAWKHYTRVDLWCVPANGDTPYVAYSVDIRHQSVQTTVKGINVIGREVTLEFGDIDLTSSARYITGELPVFRENEVIVASTAGASTSLTNNIEFQTGTNTPGNNLAGATTRFGYVVTNQAGSSNPSATQRLQIRGDRATFSAFTYSGDRPGNFPEESNLQGARAIWLRDNGTQNGQTVNNLRIHYRFADEETARQKYGYLKNLYQL